MTHVLQNHSQSPLIGIIVEENGREVVRYFTEEKAADAAVSQTQPKRPYMLLARGAILIGMRQWQRLIASGMKASPPHPLSY
jgi:hypothetical protein